MTENILDELLAFEEGMLEEDAMIDLFQRLIDDGTAWRLQGSYGRIASALIEEGKCMLGLTRHRDVYGSYIPSRFEVQPGSPGSPEYVERHQTDTE